MKADPRAIFAAAAKAQEAVTYLDGFLSTIAQRSAA
jgi:antirestriction protein ArdC